MKMRYNFNKYLSVSLSILMLTFGFVSKAWSQAGQCNAGGCTMVGTSYGAAQSTTSATFVNSVAGTWGGEYNTYNVTSGNQYEWSLCTADGATSPTNDSQLTLKTTANATLCYSDDLCGARPKILWSATFTGQVRVLVNQYNCASNTSSHTVRWRQVSAAPTGPVSCTNASAYPFSGAIYTGDEEIFNVTFGTLNNTSTCATTAPGAGSQNQKYANYAGVVSAPVVNPGQLVNWSVNVGTCGGWYGVNLRIYFDWNLNGSFGDVGENPVNITAINGVNSGTITIPAAATVGTVRMRVIATEGVVPGPTGTYGWGETEDYCVQVAAAVNCSGTPNNGLAAISTASGCPNANFILSATNFSFGTGVSYQWQSAPTATGPWSNITGATSTTFTTSVASTTFYRLNTSCLFSATSSQSNVVSYTATGGSCECGPYPINAPLYNYYNDITNVTIGGINNSSTCATVAPGPGSSLNLYANYTTSVGSANLQQGQLATFSLTSTGCVFGSGSNFFQIYIDYNADGDFLDAGELVYFQPVNAGGDQTLTGSFVVAPTAPVGTTRMRIVNINYGTPGTYNYAHLTNFYGESEDYCVTISLPPPCAGTPSPGNTIASPNSVFAGQTTTLTLQNVTTGTGITYQWQSAASATGPWTNISGATSFNYLATPTASTWYQCIVTCSNSASSGTSNPVQVLYNPYCNPAYTYGTNDGDLISNVAITGTTLNNNSGTTPGGPAYTYYSNLPAAVMQAATSYQVQVTAGSFTNQNFAVWIDYNDNYIFEASEKVGFTTAATSSAFQTVSFQINLACTPPLGIHRMRVRGVYATSGSSIQPCATYSWGETEDYNVNIIAAVPFTPSFTVTPGNQACTFTDYTYTTQTGMQSYTWSIPGTAGVNYNIISGGTSTSSTTTVQYLTAGAQTVSLNYLNASGCASTGPVSNTITVQATAQIAPLAGTQTVCTGATVAFSTASTGGTWSSSNTAVATINPNTGVVTGVAAGTATMTYTILNSTTWCPPSTATRTVTVLPSPIVNAGNDVTICSSLSSNMNASVNFNTSCSHTIVLYDSFGDGWNGCNVTVSVGGVPVLSNITLPFGSGPLSYTFTASNGAPIQVTFGAGSWIYEPYYTIVNGAGANLVTNYFPGGSGTWNGTASGCPSITPVWSPAAGLSNTGILNPVATPTATTTYTVSATGTNGCVGSDQVIVNVNPSPANAPVVAPATLCVGSNGAVSNPVPNGTWSTSTPSVLNLNPATGDIVGVSSGTAAVSYTTTAVNGCTTTTTANIAVEALPVATIASSNGTSICQGTSTTLTAPAAASYAWNNGATTQSIAVAAGGSYSVIITSAAGCVSNPSAPMALTVNQPPVVNVALSGPTSFCQGGSVSLTATGGVSYLWNNGSTTATNTINASGTYFPIATDVNGCSTTGTPITVDVLPAPAASITANGPVDFCEGSNVVLAANGAGTYAWSNGSTAASIAVNNSGSYAYTVTGANGCTTTTAPTVVTVTPLPVVASISGANTVCQGANTLFTNATAGGTWSSSNAAVAAVDATGAISGVAGGNATISYVVSNNGCSTTQTKNISVQTAPATSIAVSGPTTFCAGGSVVLTAAAGSGFAWTNSSTAQSITVTQSGTYGVAVTSGQGCASIAAPVTIDVVAFPVLDAIAGNSAVCVGSATPLTNTTAGGAWTTSNAAVASVSAAGEVSGNSAGTATISYTYTNATGCTSVVTKPIAVNVVPVAVTSISGPTTFCAGNTVTITAPAADSYVWSTNETTQSITVAASGSYDVAVTTAGCSATSAPVAVVVNALPTPVVTTNNVAICQGTAATLSSTPAAAYAWSNGETTSSINVTSAGNYAVTVTDANGCSATSTPLAIAVSASPSISIAAAGPTTFCQGQSVVLNTNTNGSTFSWSNGATSPSITVNTTGLYFVTVTNAAGCSAVSNEISVDAQVAFVPTITAASTTTVCEGAFATLIATPGASYVWSNGQTTQGVNVGVSGPITVTVTNSLGCAGTSAPINVTVLPVPTTTITASGPLTFCEGGSVTLTAGGANSYMWANNATATTQTVTMPGTYVVTGYSANGCPDLAEVTVVVNEAPVADLILDGNTSLCPGETLTISAQPGNVYNWTTGSTAQAISVTTPGTYSCILTSLNGCTTNAEQIVVTAAQATSSTLNVTALENYVLNEIIYTQSGTYTQTLTNAAGCDSTITLNLTLTVGLDEQTDVSFSVQPNPTDAVFTLKASEALYSNYVIQDAQGKVVATGALNGTSTTIDIDQVARGIYFLKVAEAAEAIRIVKN
ncbi:MAG: GEVED domain-containing protein [Crocinitomicaceae bacterium]|nr:GEVED domain-containing protein [Crocinitomicaceae bacterium]MDP4799310.1 GEVED domain-containing protein [Crocinitomicaceae bacterium]MDP4955195.1 GEVED domain-containing protein [Crocinitomicaceae bacterium]